MNPKVSIIMPVHNAEKFIDTSIKSVLNQNYRNFELIIIEDFSSDNSLHHINKYKDDRIILIKNNSNIGISESINLGILLAKGQYIARMDADDIMLPNKIDDQIMYIEKNNIDFCGTFIKFFGNLKKVIKYPISNKDIRFYMLFGSPFAHPTVMFKKSIIQDYKFEKRPAEDFDIWTKIASDNKIKFGNISSVYLNYRVHQNQISFNKTKIVNDTIKICQNYSKTYLDNKNFIENLSLLNYGMNEKYNIVNSKKLIDIIFVISKQKFITKQTRNTIILSFLNKTNKISLSFYFTILKIYFKYDIFSLKFFSIFTYIFLRQFVR